MADLLFFDANGEPLKLTMWDVDRIMVIRGGEGVELSNIVEARCTNKYQRNAIPVTPMAGAEEGTIKIVVPNTLLWRDAPLIVHLWQQMEGTEQRTLYTGEVPVIPSARPTNYKDAEFERQQNELERIANEEERKANELERIAAEAQRVANENRRIANEAERIQHELGRVAAEEGRVAAEEQRVSAEEAREAAETRREELVQQMEQATEEAQNAAQSANTAAETANTAAQGANEATEEANTAAERAETAVSELGDMAERTEQAASAANSAAGRAEAAATDAEAATVEANSAAQAAGTAATAANEAAQRVNGDINDINSVLGYNFHDFPADGFESGSFNEFGANTINPARIRSKGFSRVQSGLPLMFEFDDDLNAAVSYFVDEGVTERINVSGWRSSGFLSFPPAGAHYCRIAIKRADNSEMSPDDMTAFAVRHYTLNDCVNALPIRADITDWFESGGLYNGEPVDNKGRIRTRDFIPVRGGERCVVRATSIYNDAFYAVYTYAVVDGIKVFQSTIGGGLLGEGFVVPANADHIKIVFGVFTWKVISVSDFAPVEIALEGALHEERRIVANGYYNGRMVYNDSTERKFRYEYMGNLVNKQSFCKYNGKYYCPSPDGSLSILNADFSLDRTVSINLGHANGMQRGEVRSNYAYVSGWDDNMVHVVNLDTVEMVREIALPTTGYTTVATDDVNELMYIFQRFSQPNTKEYYNFIVYDYANERILSTRKIALKFAAMQDCMYRRGMIIVTYGVGTAQMPPGAFVCNTAGDILYEISMMHFDGNEPEGVCFDEDAGRLLISIYLNTAKQTRLYQITESIGG